MMGISPNMVSETFCFILLYKICCSFEKVIANFLILLKKIIIIYKKAIKDKNKEI